jgi:hypothetical protein
VCSSFHGAAFKAWHLHLLLSDASSDQYGLAGKNHSQGYHGLNNSIFHGRLLHAFHLWGEARFQPPPPTFINNFHRDQDEALDSQYPDARTREMASLRLTVGSTMHVTAEALHDGHFPLGTAFDMTTSCDPALISWALRDSAFQELAPRSVMKPPTREITIFLICFHVPL